jgi:hypothetical protein
MIEPGTLLQLVLRSAAVSLIKAATPGAKEHEFDVIKLREVGF